MELLTAEEKKAMFENLLKHLSALQEEMVKKQNQMLSSPVLPPATLIDYHRNMVKLGETVMWLTRIAESQFPEFLSRQNNNPKLIVN